MARPSKYKVEYVVQVKKFALLGMTDAEMAICLDVSESTFNKWKLDHPEFSESLKEGKEFADGDVAESLYNKAVGGDTTACIFWLKNRKSSQWRDKQESTIEFIETGVEAVLDTLEALEQTNDREAT